MSKIAPVDRPDLRSLKREHCCRMTIKGDEFDLVGLVVFVDVNNSAYVASFKT